MNRAGWVVGALLFVLHVGLSVLDFLAHDGFFVWRVIAMCCVGYVLVTRWDVWNNGGD